MSTRAKYERVPAKSEVAETKADTDIILRRSAVYGMWDLTQASILEEP
jgi:hypothetical protein